jgi:hypothetical protein
MTLLFTAATSASQGANWSLGGSQFLFIVILVFAVIGFQRGWRRELVSFGFSMGALLLLFIDQGKWIADFLFNKLPQIGQLIVSGSGSSGTTDNVNDGNLLLTKLIVLVLMMVVGYLVGNKAFPRPATPQERLFGILPAIVGGYFLVFYLTNYLQPSTSSGGANSQITVGINTPNQDTVGSSVLIIFLIAIVVVIAALIAANTKKTSGGKK